MTKHRKYKKGARGFTLLETMLYILLTGVVLSFATMFFMQLITTRAKARAIEEVSQNARFALSRVSVELREANDINFGSSIFNNVSGVLSLKSSNPSFDPTVFSVVNGELMIQKGTGQAYPLTTSNVEVTEFFLEDISTMDRTRAIRAKITVQFRNNGGLETFNASVSMDTTVRMRRSDGYSLAPPTPIPVFRVNEYYISSGFTGTTYNLSLNQSLAQDYFVIVKGADGTGLSTGNTGPNANYVSLTSDPFGTGDLALSGSSSSIGLSRNANVNGWQGVVTVVECVAGCNTKGFRLKSVERVVHSGTSVSGTDTSAVSWNALAQTMLIGGMDGSGCDSAQSGIGNHIVCNVRIWPSGTSTINWTRDGTGGTLSLATSTVMVVEWGSEWTVQRVNVSGTSGGNGVNAASEYDSAAINPVTRANTWVWGTGHTNDNGIGDSGSAVLVTLGNGATQNVSESLVSVGIEYSQLKDYEVYALTHPNLAVDYRFKIDGDTGATIVDVPVDPATTANQRMGLSVNGQNGVGTAYPRPFIYARYFDNTTIRLERRRSGQPFPAWIQGIDFSAILTL